ncbi:LPS translocon maturation chaperone LptM [Marinicauda pacifica]|jgi:hypothetical protein|uniref:LPS translocon maturation chaperone LptM n=1 Tax=Marinicauda pacifica TaxID=1133559 RepID=UPI0035C879A7
MKALLLLLAGPAALALSACGIRGDLDRPAPLWGPGEQMDDAQSGETDAADDDVSSPEEREDELLRDLDRLDEPGR